MDMSDSTQIIGAIQPPPGVEANFVDPSNRTAGTLALHIVCLTFTTIWLGIYGYTRLFILSSGFGLDDGGTTR